MKYLFTLVAFLLCHIGFAQTKVSVEQAHTDLSKRRNKIQLVDVRTTKEFESKHLKNAIHMDWREQESFDKKTQKLNKKNPVYVYCLSGGRSVQAAKKLAEQGFKVYEIEGGIMDWESKNLPLEQLSKDLKGLDKKQFDHLIQSHEVVLVDFYAEWCGPCKTMMPTIAAIQQKYPNVKVIKIDTDQNSLLTKSLKISSIPLFHIYKNGKLTWSQKGVVEQAVIEANL